MFKKIWHKISTTVAGGAIIIAGASILSRILGLIRDRLFATNFGGSGALDPYYAAFKLPDLVFNILVLGALSASFIPIFVKYLESDHTENKAEAWHLANSVLNILVLGLLVIGFLFFIFARQLIPLIAPGFSPENQIITIKLTRIMLIAIVFFGASNIASGILNSFKRYMAFAIAPIMYNVGIIFGIIFLAPRYGLYGLGYGVVIGAILHFLIQLPSIIKVGWRWQPIFDYKHSGVIKIAKLMLPRTLGLAVNQVDKFVYTIIASTLAAGSLTVFNMADNLQNFPINVFGVSLAIAAFPIFSQAFAEQDKEKFVVSFSTTVRRILFLIIPASALMLLLRAQIVRVVLGAAKFDWTATKLTANILGLFVISLFAQSLIPLLARSFYAHQDTKTPVKIAFVSVIFDIIFSIILSHYFGVLGLALAFSLANIINMTLLIYVLRKRMGYLDDNKIYQSILKIISATAIMCLVVWLMLHFLALGVNMQKFVGILIQGTVAGVVGIIVYLIMSLVLKCDEIKIIRDWIFRVKKQVYNGNNGKSEIPNPKSETNSKF